MTKEKIFNIKLKLKDIELLQRLTEEKSLQCSNIKDRENANKFMKLKDKLTIKA